MKIQHTAKFTVPIDVTAIDFLDAAEALRDVPMDAKVSISTTPRSYDQRDNTSFGGYTTFTVSWET